MRLGRRVFAGVILASLVVSGAPAAVAQSGGSQLTWAVHISLAPTWFDPAENPGLITPMMTLYAIHDALVKPMPGNAMAPSLAESWSVSRDGLSYDFALRKNVKFHNGETMTADDVKFSFERYRGGAAKLLKAKVADVEIVDAHRVRFKLKEPWPDFMAFFGTPATGAAWIVPRKYVQQVGEDHFKSKPVGAGPYKLVSHNPGVEVVLEAFDGYWRKAPAVKKLVWRIVPDENTRLAMLKRGEVDIAYSLRGPLAEEVKRTSSLKLAPVLIPATFWIDFGAEQWNAKSPWSDRRVRLAAALAIDRDAINQAETLGHSKVTATIIPSGFEFTWSPPLYKYDPAQAKKLLAEAGYPNGFDAGEMTVDVSYGSLYEAVANYLGAVGIRTKLRPLERAAWNSQWRDKKLKAPFEGSAGAFGSASTRLENYVIAGGGFVYGSYPDLDDLFVQQARETDRKKREAQLHRIQQLMHERVMHVPIWELGFLNGVGARVDEPGLGLIPYHPYSSPYEDLRLKR